ncbi:hypothetical protein BJ741DRAFT_601994 [Chytriomyces cf. hyalinus JEL632]|nr:hypothetical protein BJ741DRAFT_601994 [Chytriomyces cf. hyalinus JEL632]
MRKLSKSPDTLSLLQEPVQVKVTRYEVLAPAESASATTASIPASPPKRRKLQHPVASVIVVNDAQPQSPDSSSQSLEAIVANLQEQVAAMQSSMRMLIRSNMDLSRRLNQVLEHQQQHQQQHQQEQQELQEQQVQFEDDRHTTTTTTTTTHSSVAFPTSEVGSQSELLPGTRPLITEDASDRVSPHPAHEVLHNFLFESPRKK